MAEPTYDPYAYSDIGRRALGGEYINAMNFFWFDPVTGEEGQTTEGWSRVPDYAKPYTYLDPASRNQARNTFYESGAAFGGTGGFGGGMGGLLSGQAYAQQIAGGMPFEQVVAPGMSFSPDQPMGYIAEGATPFQPRPAFFPSVQDPSVGMTGADLGLPMGAGTPMPAGVTFDPESIRQIPAPSVMGSPLRLDIDVDELLKNNIEPVITLHHFSHPIWFDKLGAFEKEKNISHLVSFCDKVFSHYSNRVKYWCTINEPGVVAIQGYFTGMFPPGETNGQKAGEVYKNLLESHVQIYKSLKKLPNGNLLSGKPSSSSFSFAIKNGVDSNLSNTLSRSSRALENNVF